MKSTKRKANPKTTIVGDIFFLVKNRGEIFDGVSVEVSLISISILLFISLQENPPGSEGTGVEPAYVFKACDGSRETINNHGMIEPQDAM